MSDEVVMRSLAGATCGLAVAFILGASAQAQTTAPLPATPQKLALAQRLVDASGAKKNADAVMMIMFQQISTSLGPSLHGPDDKAFLNSLIQDEFSKVSTKVVASSAQIYAQTFTDRELTDLVAFYDSPTGRAFVNKIPDVLRQTNAATAPLIPQLQKDMLDKIFDYVCRKQKCTPEQLKQVDAAKAQALAQYQRGALPATGTAPPPKLVPTVKN